MGQQEIRGFVSTFNEGDFTYAKKYAGRLIDKGTDSKFYGAINSLIDALIEWDLFNYKGVVSNLQKAQGKLGVRAEYKGAECKEFCNNCANFLKIVTAIKEDRNALNNFFKSGNFPAGKGRDYLIDLISNALRRASMSHYDDAVARLSSAIEKTAQIAFVRKGINNGKVALANLNGADELRNRYKEDLDRDKKCKIGCKIPLRS